MEGAGRSLPRSQEGHPSLKTGEVQSLSHGSFTVSKISKDTRLADAEPRAPRGNTARRLP